MGIPVFSIKPLSGGGGGGSDPRVTQILEKIPAQATANNKLADKEFVNSSIATETAHYISDDGEPFTSVADLPTTGVTNNDYAFVTGTDTAGNTYYDRYKATVSGTTVTWAKEYRLNNSSFTAEQWAAIQSGITAALVTKLQGMNGVYRCNYDNDLYDDVLAKFNEGRLVYFWEQSAIHRGFYVLTEGSANELIFYNLARYHSLSVSNISVRSNYFNAKLTKKLDGKIAIPIWTTLDFASDALIDQTLSSSNTKIPSSAAVTNAINGKAVRFDAAQTLSDAQKTQAKTNLGVSDPIEVISDSLH